MVRIALTPLFVLVMVIALHMIHAFALMIGQAKIVRFLFVMESMPQAHLFAQPKVLAYRTIHAHALMAILDRIVNSSFAMEKIVVTHLFVLHMEFA